MDATDMRYLELLSRLFPSADKASAEIINLSAILNLPKGTEFFASDIHGEYEAFSHTLRNGSGSIRLKIDKMFTGLLTGFPGNNNFILTVTENNGLSTTKTLKYYVPAN